MRRVGSRVVCVCLIVLIGSVSGSLAGLGTSRPAAAVSPDFSITTSPALDPSFSPSIFDYAVRCAGSPTTQVTTAGSGPVTVGATTFAGPVNLSLPLVVDQGLKITNGGTTYNIRCLPSDFPTYSATVTGQPQQANGYLLTVGSYVVVFDTDGVPVWWYQDKSATPIDAKFFGPTTISWNELLLNQYVLHGLDGTLKATVGGGAVPLDFHDLQLLPNGNYLGIMDVTRNCPAVPSQCVDLSSWGLSASATITDNVIVELNPANQIVWQWSVADHINVAAANVNWHDQFPDVIHMNSILYDGNGGIIFSARHLDAVYRIDMATGALTWKLGGSLEPESLTVTGDPYLGAGGQLFSGQHYARFAPDGSLTVQDNGTRAGRAPRAVRFVIDPSTASATEVEQVTDPRAPTALCCGSVEKLSGGDWVASWGYNDFMTELNPQGVPQITITYPSGGFGTQFSYREADVPATVASLRQGMDAMVPPLTDVPSTSLLIPSNGSTLTGTEYLDATAADPVGVTGVEFRLFGGIYGFAGPVVCTATLTLYGWLCPWDTTTVPNGSYALVSEVFNSAGSAFSSGVSITVNNPLPTTSVLVPSNGATLSGSTYIDASASNATSVEFRLFGGIYGFAAPVVCTATLTLYGWLCDWNTTTAPNGSYVLVSEASNTVGSKYSSGVNITVKN